MTARIEIRHHLGANDWVSPYLAPAPPGSAAGGNWGGMLLTLAGATPDTTTQRAGSYFFNANDGTITLRVIVQTPLSMDPSHTTVLDFQQTFTVSGGSVTLGDANAWRRGATKHPRVQNPATCSPSRGSHATACIELDLRFIDVTPAFRAVAPNHPLMVSANLLSFNHTCSFYQYTAGQVPIWAVLRPTNYPSRADIPVVHFFRPSSTRPERRPPDARHRRPWTAQVPIVYTSFHDVPLPSLVRYFLRASDYNRITSGIADDAQPFFVQAGQRGVGWQGYPACRFAKQLFQANKNVILTYPVPIGSDYGSGTGGALLSSLDGMVTALWGDGHVGDTLTTGVARGRLAIGGFSAGGHQLWSCLNDTAARTAIREVYAFDPMAVAGKAPLLNRWLNLGRGDRRLRLIRGGEWTDVTRVATALGVPTSTTSNLPLRGHGNITCWPENSDFFLNSWVYKSAYQFQEFTVDGAAPSPISRISGLFLSPTVTATQNQTSLIVRDAADVVVGAPIDRPYANTEAAGMALVNVRPNIRTIRNLRDAWSGVLPNSAYGLRHQWTVCGGQSADDDLPRLVGYLQLCLENSGF